jgi:hypothetical protein
MFSLNHRTCIVGVPATTFTTTSSSATTAKCIQSRPGSRARDGGGASCTPVNTTSSSEVVRGGGLSHREGTAQCLDFTLNNKTLKQDYKITCKIIQDRVVYLRNIFNTSQIGAIMLCDKKSLKAGREAKYHSVG